MTDTTAVGWRADAAADAQRSLPEVNSTISVPFGGHWSRRLLAFLQAAFAGSDEFERDSRQLEKAIARGACTVAAGILPANHRSYRRRKNAGETPALRDRPPRKAK